MRATPPPTPPPSWSAWLTAAAVAVIVAVMAPGAAIATVAAGCHPSCGATFLGDGAVGPTTGSPMPASCIHVPGCGGAGVLSHGVGTSLAVIAVPSLGAAAALAALDRRRLVLAIGRVHMSELASRLFRPPRIALA